METESGIGVSRQVVEKHVAGGFCFFCGGSLLVRYFVEGGDDRRITPPGVVQESACNLLDTADASQVEEWRKVGGCKLGFSTVSGGCPEMRGMLRTLWRGVT